MSYNKLIEKGRWFIQITEDYSNVFSPSFFNWVEFTFIKFYVENNKIFGIFEVEICLLGLGFNIQYLYDREKMESKLKKYSDQIDDFIELVDDE